MKFSSFKEFRNSVEATAEVIAEYLRVDVTKVLKELQVGLSKLTFVENFSSFKVEVSIAAGAELAIRNQLRNKVPTERIFVRGDSTTIVDGDTEWDLNYVYLKNTGAAAVTATVIFLE